MIVEVRKNPRIRPRVSEGAWIHRDFLKEKLRVRERYWHALAPENVKVRNENGWIVVPDGLAWRKYLPLLSHLVEQPTQPWHWILLESAVECMDYRNSSPCLEVNETKTPEAAAVQERSKLQRLLERKLVSPFCDLSVRAEENDEWNLLHFDEMNTLERCNHALMRAGAMFLQQQRGKDSPDAPKVALVSSEPDFFRGFALEDGMEFWSMDDLLEKLVIESTATESKETLLQWKLRCEEAYELRNNPSPMQSDDIAAEQHLSEEEVAEGLRNKTLIIGRLNVTKENPKEGYVVLEGGSSYFVDQTRGHFNRALHHDVVILHPLDEAQWGRPIGRRRLVHHRDNDDSDASNIVPSDGEAVPSARVVAIAEPSRRQFIATLVDLPMNDENACLVVPMDIRIPKIRIRSSGWRRFVGQRLLVQVDGWEVGNSFPAGHCVDMIGPVADLETEIQCILYENQLHLQPFSAAARSYLPAEGHDWKIPVEEIERRKDLRSSHRIFSVDPQGCQDIDDTMHARGKFDRESSCSS